MRPDLIEGLAWEDLAVLLAATDHRSLNRAARALRVSQSTASRRLARLEQALGVRLFDRTPEGLRPTDFATRLVPLARLIEGHMGDIARMASGEELHPRGQVRLALPSGLATAWLIPRMEHFYARYPEVDLDLLIGDVVLDLVRREADLALRFVRPTQPDLLIQTLGMIPLAPVAQPEVAALPAEERRWIALRDPNGILLETRWIEAHARPRRLLRVSSWNALFVAAKAGLGAALISPLVAEPAGLAQLPGLPPVEGRPLYMVCHQALRAVPRVAALRGWLAEEARGFLVRR